MFSSEKKQLSCVLRYVVIESEAARETAKTSCRFGHKPLKVLINKCKTNRPTAISYVEFFGLTRIYLNFRRWSTYISLIALPSLRFALRIPLHRLRCEEPTLLRKTKCHGRNVKTPLSFVFEMLQSNRNFKSKNETLIFTQIALTPSAGYTVLEVMCVCTN